MSNGAGVLYQLSDEARRRVLATASRRRFARGEVIFHEGDPGEAVHVVAKGHVAIRVTTRLGDVATLRVLGAGEIFGEQALIATDHRRVATALAIDPVETHVLRREQFDELRRTHPEVDRFLVEALVLQIRRLTKHLQEALFVASDKRVLRRLVDLCEFYRAVDGTAVIPMTQTDIASMAGASRSTANRVFKTAEDAGLVELRRGRVHVLDPDALALEATDVRTDPGRAGRGARMTGTTAGSSPRCGGRVAGRAPRWPPAGPRAPRTRCSPR